MLSTDDILTGLGLVIVLAVTAGDDYNALVAHELRAVLGHAHVHLVTATQARESAVALRPRPGGA